MGSNEEERNTAADDAGPRKRQRFDRTLGTPPSSLGAQSDSSGMQAQRSALLHVATAIDTVFFESRLPRDSMHAMMLLVYDTTEHRPNEVGPLRHSVSQVPRLTVLGINDEVNLTILDAACRHMLPRPDGVPPPPPCSVEFIQKQEGEPLAKTVRARNSQNVNDVSSQPTRNPPTNANVQRNNITPGALENARHGPAYSGPTPASAQDSGEVGQEENIILERRQSESSEEDA